VYARVRVLCVFIVMLLVAVLVLKPVSTLTLTAALILTIPFGIISRWALCMCCTVLRCLSTSGYREQWSCMCHRRERVVVAIAHVPHCVACVSLLCVVATESVPSSLAAHHCGAVSQPANVTQQHYHRMYRTALRCVVAAERVLSSLAAHHCGTLSSLAAHHCGAVFAVSVTTIGIGWKKQWQRAPAALLSQSISSTKFSMCSQRYCTAPSRRSSCRCCTSF
jgi:uncharacterized membrane protein YjgN (DUF898 family)